jgi:NAD(P)H-nitrite reductase large subunit
MEPLTMVGVKGGSCCAHGSLSDFEGPTFVRILLLRGRLQGAVLVGDTGLEETFENLILDGIDLSAYGPALLDPDVELDHMFD